MKNEPHHEVEFWFAVALYLILIQKAFSSTCGAEGGGLNDASSGAWRNNFISENCARQELCLPGIQIALFWLEEICQTNLYKLKYIWTN